MCWKQKHTPQICYKRSRVQVGFMKHLCLYLNCKTISYMIVKTEETFLFVLNNLILNYNKVNSDISNLCVNFHWSIEIIKKVRQLLRDMGYNGVCSSNHLPNPSWWTILCYVYKVDLALPSIWWTHFIVPLLSAEKIYSMKTDLLPIYLWSKMLIFKRAFQKLRVLPHLHPPQNF